MNFLLKSVLCLKMILLIATGRNTDLQYRNLASLFVTAHSLAFTTIDFSSEKEIYSLSYPRREIRDIMDLM